MEQGVQKKESREASLKAQLRKEIEEGIAISRDPANAVLPDLAARTTTIYSRWYTRACPECKHRFRGDDQVRLCPDCDQAYHDDSQYDLHCWQKHFANDRVCRPGRYDPIAEAHREGCHYKWSGRFPDEAGSAASEQPIQRVAQVTDQFLQGVSAVWQPYGDEQVMEVKQGSPIVGHKCPWCRFEVRAGDRVVRCPCGNCDTYFHNDIFRHLECWNGWNGARGNDFCPTTGDKIEQLARPD